MKLLSASALNVLSSGVAITGNALTLTCGQLDRKLYLEVNAALEAIGGTWNRKQKAHLFEESPEDALDQILVDGGFHDVKRDLNQFFTPPALAREIVQRAKVEGMSVLEPSAGDGALAIECIRQGAKRLMCIEPHPTTFEKLDKRLTAERFPAWWHCGDFMQHDINDKYDRVVMNPPFARQQDIDHVLRAFDLLKKGGTLTAIMSAGTKDRSNKKAVDFRALVKQAHGTIESLPDGSFKESGTNVRTVLVTMRHP